MAEKAVAGDVGIGQLTAEQTTKLVEFTKGLQQSALEALGTTLDKKLDIGAVTHEAADTAAASGSFSGMFVVVDSSATLEDDWEARVSASLSFSYRRMSGVSMARRTTQTSSRSLGRS